MAMETVDNVLITQFSDMIHNKAQQIKARLRPYVEIRSLEGDELAYDGLGDVEVREVFGRIQPTIFDDINHTRRKLARRRFVVTLPIDASDVRGSLLNPEGKYAKAAVMAFERQFDRVVVEAAFASVLTGRNFDTTVTFANDGGFTVDATGGTTYEKLLELHTNWIDADVGNDTPVRKVLCISGDEHNALMQETNLISGDFTRVSVIDNGEMVRAAGLEIVKFGASARRPILPVSSGTRSCVAFIAGGIAVGMSKAMTISIDKRPDHVELSQVQIVGSFGAVRTEGALVQKFNVTDA